MSREATSEQSSVHDRVGYDEVFQTGLDPEEGLSLSSKREALTHSLTRKWRVMLEREVGRR